MDALVNIIYKFLFRITAVNNDLSEALTYSTDETIIGKWVNGVNIYRKVLGFTPTAVHTDIDIRNLGLRYCISVRGLCSQFFNNPRIPIPSYYSAAYHTTCGLDDKYNIGGNRLSNLWVEIHSTNNEYLNHSAIIIIDYLKE